jgi:hypothetical protein
MGKRRDRFDQRALDQKTTRSVNGPLKAAERVRRDKRMKAALQAGKMPYTRVVRNWLAVKLQKHVRQITQADVDKILKG